MIRYLMNDFVVQEQICNLRCTYCLNFENELKGVTPWAPQQRLALSPGADGFERARRALESAARHGEAPILKISGGEVFAVPGAVEFIEQVATEWHRVQILTNGTLLTDARLERLARIPNLNFCVSLDGHTAEANHLRTPSERLAQRICDAVAALTELGVPVEVYTVVSSANLAVLEEFVAWLAALPRRADLRFVPFPVRGDAAQQAKPDSEEAFRLFRSLAENVAEHGEVMLPAAYYRALAEVYVVERRTRRCRVPLTHIQTFDDGVIAACPNCWSAKIGNLNEDEDPFAGIGRAKMQRLFLRDPPRVPFCRGCFTPFDLVNLYIDGEVGLDEMRAIDLFSTSPVAERLVQLRAAVGGADAQPIRDMAMEASSC